MKCQIKYSVLFMKKINNKFYVFLNIAIKNLRVGNILQRMCLFLGSACFTKPPSPASVPSIENGMPLMVLVIYAQLQAVHGFVLLLVPVLEAILGVLVVGRVQFVLLTRVHPVYCLGHGDFGGFNRSRHHQPVVYLFYRTLNKCQMTTGTSCT